MVPRRLRRRLRIRANLLLGHAGRGQRLHVVANCPETSRVFARELDRVEEPLLLRDLRSHRKNRRKRAWRKLRRRKTHILPYPPPDGAARDRLLGVPPEGRFMGVTVCQL